MKKKLITLLSVVFCFCVAVIFVGCSPFGGDDSDDDVVFVYAELADGTYEVSIDRENIPNPVDPNVVVPSKYNGKAVTKISGHCFEDCSFLETVSVPSSIKSIGEYAFYNCNIINKLTLPSSVENFGKYAFGYTQVKNVYYSGTIADWCKIDFEVGDNSSLDFGEIEDTSTPMRGDTTFYLKSNNSWSKITTLTIPQGLTQIGDLQFSGFSQLTNINIASSVVTIGDYAFKIAQELQVLRFLRG